ncbi:MAG: hypothetical protein AB8F94_00930 [Saprospiraceae bacterium]
MRHPILIFFVVLLSLISCNSNEPSSGETANEAATDLASEVEVEKEIQVQAQQSEPPKEILPELTDEEIWGIGLLQLPYEGKMLFKLYDAPNGNKNGTLGMEEKEEGPSSQVWRNTEGIWLTTPERAIMEYDYEIDGFIVLQEKDSFIQILPFDGGEESWASIAEIEKEGAKYQSWKDFMITSNRNFFTSDYGMNLRVSPTIEAEKILTVKGDQFEIKLTGKTEGLWGEVMVEEYDSDYCSSPRNLVKEHRGWLKLLDDKGFPNLWYYTRGC